MKFIDPSVELLSQAPGLEGVYKQIELVGRTCYSPSTEVLTDHGWKRIDKILSSDKVVSYNPVENTIIYDYPNIIVKDYDDEMIEINHPNIKLCVTKDHRIYQSVPEKRCYNFIKASQLAGIEKILNSRQCRFRIPKYFAFTKRNMDIHIPSIIYSKEILHGNRPSSEVSIKLPCNEDFMIIAGAFISEGNTSHRETYGSGSYCQITQTEDTPLYNNVISALNNLGWKYRINSNPRKPKIKWIKFGTNQCWVTAFDDLFGHGSKNKHLPTWFRSLPDNYLRILINNMYLGDGSHNTSRNERYLSISKRLLNEVQEVFIILGTSGTVHFNEDISQMDYFEESHRDSWIVSRSKHINTFHYTGKVYCTSTKSGIICIKYKDQTCWCGNCYNSENKITETSAKPFVDRMIASGHNAMLEFGTIYLKIDFTTSTMANITRETHYSSNQYSVEKRILDDSLCPIYYITTNLRVLVENNWLEDLQYICEPTEYHEQRICLKFNTDIGVSREGNRHRKFSIAEQSTRYCNYNSDKFDSQITFVKPNWSPGTNEIGTIFRKGLMAAEVCYKALISEGWRPQQARQVLPLATATEVVYTGFKSDWEHFFNLRYKGTTGAPHPNMKQVATMAYNLVNNVK